MEGSRCFGARVSQALRRNGTGTLFTRAANDWRDTLKPRYVGGSR
jgi:hypothetical protein